MTLQEVIIALNLKAGLETESKGLSLFSGLAYHSYPIGQKVNAASEWSL